MEEPPQRPRSLWQRDWFLLVLLLLLAGGIHAWMIQHTAVAARDSIGFIRYAWHLQHCPWNEVMQAELHPPLYPISVLAVSVPVRQLLHTSDSLAMQYSAQLASSLAGVLLVIPMFYIGRELLDRWVGFWAALLFHCLPVGSRALSDGLAEGIYLLLAATLFLFTLRGLRTGSAIRLGVCGVCGGLAYLARPEGALLVLATGVVLVGMQAVSAWRKPWLRTLTCAATLSLGALAVSMPYMITIGGFTNKTSTIWIWESLHDVLRHVLNQNPETFQHSAQYSAASSGLDGSASQSAPTPFPLASIFAAWRPQWSEGNHVGDLSWGIREYIQEVGKGFHYIVWLPALLGLWWFRERLRVMPGLWVMILVCTLQTLFLLRLATVAGYISERHSVMFVLCGTFWAVAGMQELPRRLSALGERLALPAAFVNWWGRRRLVEVLGVVALLACGLPSTLKTMHPTRAGFRAAGLWLAEHAEPSDEVVDPFCWAHYYAGRVFVEEGPRDESQPFVKGYVVVDKIYSKDHHSHLPFLAMAERLAARGTLVYHWPVQRPVENALVFVYKTTGP